MEIAKKLLSDWLKQSTNSIVYISIFRFLYRKCTELTNEKIYIKLLGLRRGRRRRRRRRRRRIY